MNFAQDKPGSSRLSGFGVVVAIHVIIIYGLASGLARKAMEKVVGPIETRVIEEQVKPPPPPEKVVPPSPDIKAPPPPFVPPPEFVVTAPPPSAPMAAPTSSTPPPANIAKAAPAPAAPAPAPVVAPAGPVKAGTVCTKMGKPEIPSLTWSGEAAYKVTATVKAGRVAGLDIQPLRGGVDRKAQRALVAAIESTLRDTYECPGDHVFEQEFVFRIGE